MPMTAYTGLLLPAAIGLAVGSFLTTLVLRLPRRQPIVLARSACPQCGHRLRPVELIPVLSWLIQRRRCRACGVRISAFYPVMELAAAFVAGVAARWLSGPALVAACLSGWCLVLLLGWAWNRNRLDR